MEKLLTIVLPLKDRTPFTWRWMEYASVSKFPFHIIIADGGKDKDVEKRFTDKSFFPDLDYQYIRYPYDKDTETFFKKMADSIARVKTKYVVIADNDDFLLKDGLYKAIEFLEENPDYVSSRGEVYDFQIKDKDSNIYGSIKNFRQILMAESNTGATALDRTKIFSKYSAGMWQDVARTESLSQCYRLLVETKITDFDICDHLANYLRVTFGKAHRGEGLYLLHQTHLGGLGHLMIKKDPLDWVMSENWPSDISRFLDLIAKRVNANDNTDDPIIKYKIMQYYFRYIIGENMIKGRLERKIQTAPPRIVKLGRILSKDNKVRLFLKSIYNYLYEWREDKISQKNLKSSPYHKEIMSVQSFLSKRN